MDLPAVLLVELLQVGAVALVVFVAAPGPALLVPSSVPARAVATVCLVLIELWYALQAYLLLGARTKDTGYVMRHAFLAFLVPLFIILRDGGLASRLVFAQYLTCLSLQFSFPKASSFGTLALTLNVLKSLYLGLPPDLFFECSLLVTVMTFTWGFDAYRERMSATERAAKQARIAAVELAEANLRIRESVYFSESAIRAREKQRIASELHDNIGHILTSLLLSVRNRLRDTTLGAAGALEQLKEVERLIAVAIKDFRTVVYALRDETETIMSWPLRWRKTCLVFSDCTGVRIHLEVPEEPLSIADEMGEAVMRIIKEGLSNAVRHGNASFISVGVVQDMALRLLMLKISDNGEGARAVKPGMGIQGMSERVKGLHGKLAWSTRPGMGFDLGVDLPLPRRATS